MPRKSQLEKEEVGLREGGPARQRKVKADFLKLDFLEVHICQHVPQTLSQAWTEGPRLKPVLLPLSDLLLSLWGEAQCVSQARQGCWEWSSHVRYLAMLEVWFDTPATSRTLLMGKLGSLIPQQEVSSGKDQRVYLRTGKNERIAPFCWR